MTVAATSPRPQRPNQKPAPNSGRVMVGCDVLLWIFLLERGQCLSDGVSALDRQWSLAGSPRLNGARRDGQALGNRGRCATKQADDNLHDGSLSLRRARVDHSTKPHDPATVRHQANHTKSLSGQRHRPRRERRGALNPSVISRDWLKGHGGGLLGCFDGGEKIAHVVAACLASLLSEVGAGKALTVKPCTLGLQTVTGELDSLRGLLDLVKLSGESLNGLVVWVEVVIVWVAVSLKLDVVVIVKGAACLDKLGLDFGGGAVCGVGHAQTLRKDFVGVENYLRKSFVGGASLLIPLHNVRCAPTGANEKKLNRI